MKKTLCLCLLSTLLSNAWASSDTEFTGAEYFAGMGSPRNLGDSGAKVQIFHQEQEDKFEGEKANITPVLDAGELEDSINLARQSMAEDITFPKLDFMYFLKGSVRGRLGQLVIENAASFCEWLQKNGSKYFQFGEDPSFALGPLKDFRLTKENSSGQAFMVLSFSVLFADFDLKLSHERLLPEQVNKEASEADAAE